MQNQDIRNLPFNAWVNLKTHKNSFGDNKNTPGHSQEQVDALDTYEEVIETNYIKEIKNGN